MGTVSNGFSVYLPYLMDAYGLTHAQTSSLVTFRCLVSFFAMLGIGVYYRRFSLRVGTAVAALCAALSFGIYSLAETYPVFCVGAALSGMSYGLGSMIPVSILMNKWFHQRKALALGICATGSGIATIVLPPVTTALVESLSMKTTFRLEAVAILLLTLLIFSLLRDDPKDKGLAPYGEPEPTTETPAAPSAPPAGPALTKGTWLLMGVVCLFMGALANPGFSHLSVLYTSAGFDAMVVASFLSLTGVMIVVGKLLYGQATDRMGGCRSSLLFGAVLLVGHLLCCLAGLGSHALSTVAVFLLGLGYPIATIGPSVWANDLASPAAYPTVLRRFQVIYAGGALIFASVPGILADHFGGYVPAYLLFSAMLAVALVFIGATYIQKKKRG
jgi:predicted MFS family arabinose efflux permease